MRAVRYGPGSAESREPSMRWRSFCRELVGLMLELDVRNVVLLGALLADAPHTRPVPVTGAASEAGLVSTLHLEPARYQGPTGILGVLQDACAKADLDTVSLWAAVPHYVAVAPNPKGALALLRRLESLVGVTVVATELEDAAVDYERQVNRAVELDPDVQAFVERLERANDRFSISEFWQIVSAHVPEVDDMQALSAVEGLADDWKRRLTERARWIRERRVAAQAGTLHR